MSARCADCHAEVWQLRNGHWATRNADNTGSFTCRMTIEGDRLVAADYHYVAGETQRHFRAPVTT